MANRQTLRDDVRDTLSEVSQNLTDTTLNRLISMGTDKLGRDLVADERTKPRQMMAYSAITTDSNGILTLPSDYFRARSVRADDTLYKYVSSEKLSERGILADTEVQLTYYQRLPALTDTTSNWLLDIALDLYIWACCLQYAPWAKENATIYDALYYDALAGVCESNGVTPTGGMIQQKRPQYNGFYTVYGESMDFGRI